MFKLLFPDAVDNFYQGDRLALWMLGTILLFRFAIYLNSILDSRQVLVSADGIPLVNYPAARNFPMLLVLKGESGLNYLRHLVTTRRTTQP